VENSNKNQNNKLLIISLAIILVGILTITLSNAYFSNKSDSKKSMVSYSDAHLDPYKDRPELASPTWNDSDLVPWKDDSSLAYTSFSVSTSQCGYGAGCLGIIVQTRDGCINRLYAEIEILDGSDVSIGYSNDLLGFVGAGKKAKLIFNLSDSELSQAENWNVTKISCS